MSSILRQGSLVFHELYKGNYRIGIALGEVTDNPYIKDSWRVAWIPNDKYPAAANMETIYIDHVKKQNLVVLSS